MKKYIYKYKDINDNLKTDYAFFDNDKLFIDYCSKNSLNVIFVKKKNIHLKFGLKELQLFTKQLLTLIHSNYTLEESFTIIIETAENKEFKEILLFIHKELINGKTLYETISYFNGIFPKFYIELINVGEKAFSLKVVLEKLLLILKRLIDFKDRTKETLFYPLILIFVSFFIINFLFISVLPSFKTTFESLNIKINPILNFLFKLSLFLRDNLDYYLIILILLGSLFIIYFKYFINLVFKIALFLKINFIYNIIKVFDFSRFTITMAILLENKVDISKSIFIASDNLIIKEFYNKLQSIIRDINSGTTLYIAFNKYSFFDKYFLKIIYSGEKSNELSKSFFYLNDYYEEKLDNSLKNIAIYIEPIIILTIGFIVFSTILLILLPIFGAIS